MFISRLKGDIDNSESDIEEISDLSPRDSRQIINLNIEKNQFKNSDLKYHEQNPNESVRSWLQRITAMQNEIQRKQTKPLTTNNNQIIDYQTKNNNNYTNVNPPTQQQPTPRVVKYQDLPYMGEMTLDNSKPRRGRKPKKADICHLIYKNYGTIFPGTPKNLVDNNNQETIKNSNKTQQTHKQSTPQKETQNPVQRTNVQNRIISSLLEKRLTQESQRNKELLLNRDSPNNDQNEPLNLCIKDLNQLKIRLLRKHGNIYASDTVVNEVKPEPVSDDDDVEFVDETPSPISSVKIPETSPSDTENPFLDQSTKSSDVNAGGYVYWPNAGVFIHPTALHSQLLYYQKLANSNGSYTLPSPNPEPPTTPDSPSSNPQELRKLVPKHISKLQEKPHDENEVSVDTRLKRVASQGSNTPVKRKRSAIFIPPIPTESQTNPATEVSICKFKFTGGAKPSLQEKKMLSVDSGGNFRYYSGTGDKSMRGYEFFPRETLQQAGSSHGSSTGAFLQASGEKMPILPSTTENGKPGDFLFSPETTLQPLPVGGLRDQDQIDRRHRKRKTRKSLQREKLEQTFKEKGFLIQTQQLESAEGATYCKFRQLRKFTRYLFRSWKDYLPGNVRELQEAEKSGDDDDGDIDENHENVMNTHLNNASDM